MWLAIRSSSFATTRRYAARGGTAISLISSIASMKTMLWMTEQMPQTRSARNITSCQGRPRMIRSIPFFMYPSSTSVLSTRSPAVSHLRRTGSFQQGCTGPRGMDTSTVFFISDSPRSL
ncbi:hypothetical protein DSECCO2_609300 [anaerobic digester metagenome]